MAIESNDNRTIYTVKNIKSATNVVKSTFCGWLFNSIPITAFELKIRKNAPLHF